MIFVEPRNRNDTLYVWSMCAADERTHGGYLVITVSEHPTIIITRACVVNGIDESPMPECRICFCQCEAVVTGCSFVHAQAIRYGNDLVGIANRHA
ncbi:MAG: hypothetical protein J6P74_02735 [Paludibacteraceae bacterium]|nr:hypothetical protein [Paludibacteraceae bacterium]